MITGHFVDVDLPVVDGVVRIARAYRELMDRSLGPSWLVAPHFPGAGEPDARKIAFPSIPLRNPYRLGMPALAPGLKKRIDGAGFDIIHSHTPFVAGRLAVSAARSTGKPLVFTLHSRYPDWAVAQYRRDSRWLGLLGLDASLRRPRVHRLRWADLHRVTESGLRLCIEATQRMIWSYCLKADCVLVASEAFRRELLGYADACHPRERTVAAPEIRVVRNGIDFPPVAAGAVRVRERHEVPPGLPLFLFVGQLAIEKELGFLLEALGSLAARKQDFRLLLVGQGPDRQLFERRALELGIAEKCRFVGVIADRAELADYYAQADLFLFPSLYETLGLVAMEAASFGLPLVAQKAAPGLSEVFVDQVSACFSERSPEAYGRAVLELVRRPERARALGAEARRAVRRIEQAVAQVVGIYEELRSGNFGGVTRP
jgi:glycosyltransferase involved in cell wall biosynthesis